MVSSVQYDLKTLFIPLIYNLLTKSTILIIETQNSMENNISLNFDNSN